MIDTPKPPQNVSSRELERWAYMHLDPFIVGLCKRILELEREVMDLQDRIEDDYR